MKKSILTTCFFLLPIIAVLAQLNVRIEFVDVENCRRGICISACRCEPCYCNIGLSLVITDSDTFELTMTHQPFSISISLIFSGNKIHEDVFLTYRFDRIHSWGNINLFLNDIIYSDSISTRFTHRGCSLCNQFDNDHECNSLFRPTNWTIYPPDIRRQYRVQITEENIIKVELSYMVSNVRNRFTINSAEDIETFRMFWRMVEERGGLM